MRVCRVEEMREMDKRAIEGFAVPEELLMENAGAAAFRVVEQVCGVRGKRFALLCGTGNNGGDGLVVARKIHSMGGDARVFILGDSARFKGAAATNFRIVSSLPVTVKEIKSAESLKNALLESDAIVDAIFGTGLTRKVEGLHKAVIERV
ncbi:MAG TPA: NAD(P)H-hydrate epimerase, partial [Spirochaetia bacterium]|nr:NAD(P)H-hydrate epimerase [Spirochaetia bacterium]